ncbi:MAG: indolepyruvate oxidoreductase subunit beta [Desulfitobacteriia bacterium]|jgi:indolepyruvate ferredoxin oxidoreductase beta subunit
MLKTRNILIVGVGGQGTILASRVLSTVLIKAGYDVKVSEIHGMAQRGGSVVTQVRYGKKVNSPIIPKGETDVLLAFEKLEALRWLPYLKPDGVMLINDQKIDPLPVITGAAAYPDALKLIKEQRNNIIVINALEIAQKAGNSKAVNVVLLGLLAQKLDLKPELWTEALEETVPPRFLEVNLKAFAAGNKFSARNLK